MSRPTNPLTHRLTLAGLSVLSAAAIAADLCVRLLNEGAGATGALTVAVVLFLALSVVLHLATRPER